MDEARREYLAMGHGGKLICPECAGMMTAQGPLQFRCVDCHALYDASEGGLADKEITLRKARR